MSPQTQTIIALAVVAAAAAGLLWRSLAKKKNSGCGGGECAAVSPEIKRLQAKLKR